MNKAFVIIGANYGDEGKGLMTDYYSHHFIEYTGTKDWHDAMVIRFNGGSQAGHTVKQPKGKWHIFSHFGSGAFAGLPTYLSEHFVCNPMTFMKEYKSLEKKGLNPIMYVNPKCMITTPFDMIINQVIESRRDKDRHGSVGLGFGETIQRNEEFTTLTLLDLIKTPTKQLRIIMHIIRDIYCTYRIRPGINPDDGAVFDAFYSDKLIDDFIEACDFFKSKITAVDEIILDGTLIFEGAQGLMLDQNHKNFPHVTRSNTGLKNVLEILDKIEDHEVTVNYVTRSYMTKHGAGPLEHEQDLPYNIVDETNKHNTFQETLRFAPFNTETIDTINIDFEQAKGYNIQKHMTMTCMDQLRDKVFMVNDNDFDEITNDEFTNFVCNNFDYTSYGPTKDHVRRHHQE